VFGTLYCRIGCVWSLYTAYNGELMRSLQKRDELHMAQDSMLVDIDDLIRSEHFHAGLYMMDGTHIGTKAHA